MVICKFIDSVLFRMFWDDKKCRDLLCLRFIWIIVYNGNYKDWLKLKKYCK